MKAALKKVKPLIFIFAIIAVFFIGRGAQTSKIKSLAAKKVSIENRLVAKTVSVTGKVESPKFAALSFPITQRVAGVYVKRNDKVAKGQLLISLNSAALANTVQSYKDARDVVANQKELFEKNMESNKDSLGGEKQYQIKLREYEEQLNQTEALYKAQLAGLNNAFMYAPYDGTVVELTTEVGETAAAGETLIRIADITDVEFKVQIDQEDFGALQVTMPAEIELDAYPNEIFKATLDELSDFANGLDGSSFEGTLTFEGAQDKKILIGMTGEAKVFVKSTEVQVPSLYYDEIFTDEENKPYVWIDDGGYIKKLNVEVGLEGDIYTELKTTPTQDVIVPFNSDIEFKTGYKAKIMK